MSGSYEQHGRRHGPGGSDPLVPGAIVYDFENVGDWLYVTTTGAGGPNGNGIEFEADSAAMFLHTSGNTGDGTIDIAALNLSPNGGGSPDGSDVNVTASLDFNLLAGQDINIRTDASGDYPGTGRDVNVNAARDINTNADGDVNIDAGGNITMPTLPISDPGLSGALWNDSGTVKVSP